MFFRLPVVLIAMYNVLDLVGRYTPLVKWFMIKSRKGLLAAVLVRFVFIPAFYYAAKYGDQGWLILLVSVLGLTNGHLTVCILTKAPKGYKVCSPHLLPTYTGNEFELFRVLQFNLSVLFIGFPFFCDVKIDMQGPEQNALGNLLVVCLLAGIFTGVSLDWLWMIGKEKF